MIITRFGDISFLASSAYYHALKETKAAAVILEPKDAVLVAGRVPALVHTNPKYIYALVVQHLYPEEIIPNIHSTAVIAPSAIIHPTARIDAHCVIGENVVIKANTRLYPNITVYHRVYIGERCIIHSGAVIGSDGFGFANHKGKWIKVPQIGGVIIGNDVEIGSNTAIDRGAIEDTVIENNVILDNLIQVAHNVRIGEGTAIAGCAAIAGSTEIGRYCLIGGSSSISGHISIADKVHLMGCTNVARSITEPGAYASSTMEQPASTWLRTLMRLHQLEDLVHRVKVLEKKEG